MDMHVELSKDSFHSTEFFSDARTVTSWISKDQRACHFWHQMGSLSGFDRRNHVNIVLRLYSSKNGTTFDANLLVLRTLAAIGHQHGLHGDIHQAASPRGRSTFQNAAETLAFVRYIRELSLQRVEKEVFIFKTVLHLLLMAQQSEGLSERRTDFWLLL